MSRSYRIREFAKLAGVTVRALHHYDRLGLLKPKRTQTGYRVYVNKDLEILEQIVALKFMGLPLSKIKALLREGTRELAMAFGAQRTILDHKKRLLEQAIKAIGEAETALLTGDGVDSRVFRHIIEVIEMQNRSDEWKHKYDTLVQEKLERLKAMSLDDKARLRDQFADLFTQVEAAIDEDPAGPRAQALVGRYVDLLQAFSLKGELNPQLQKIVAAYLSAGEEWPADAPSSAPPFGGIRVWAFMARALAVR